LKTELNLAVGEDMLRDWNKVGGGVKMGIGQVRRPLAEVAL
jgi:hypothetical protein